MVSSPPSRPSTVLSCPSAVASCVLTRPDSRWEASSFSTIGDAEVIDHDSDGRDFGSVGFGIVWRCRLVVFVVGTNLVEVLRSVAA